MRSPCSDSIPASFTALMSKRDSAGSTRVSCSMFDRSVRSAEDAGSLPVEGSTDESTAPCAIAFSAPAASK
eukprot:31342-Pelagococcus_subviridis.AAC.14